jgi:hypothetical protein
MIPSVNGKKVHELIVYVCEKGADPELESTKKDGEAPDCRQHQFKSPEKGRSGYSDEMEVADDVTWDPGLQSSSVCYSRARQN